MEMASTLMPLPHDDDVGTDGTSLVWTIQNFSHCLHKPKECLESPSFALDSVKPDRWRLILYPNENHTDNFSDKFIVFGLHRIVFAVNSFRRLHLEVSIRTSKGSFKKIEDTSWDFSIEEHFNSFNFLEREDLREKGGDYLYNDTMTLRCRISKVDDKLLPPEQCCIRTMIRMVRETEIWSLEEFKNKNNSSKVLPTNENTHPPKSLELQSLIARKLFSYRDSFTGDRIKLELKQLDINQQCFFTCNLSLLEADGKVAHSRQEEHRFDASADHQVWEFPYIPLSKIRDFENTYLRCELAVSFGKEISWVEYVENSKLDQPTLSNLKKEQDFCTSWIEDLKLFFSEGAFKDVTLRTPNKDIPAYKAALCARSTVFHDMFAQDMAENKSGIVNIGDIDADIVHKMLLFVYSDVVEDLDFDVASKLYFVADKYRIAALRRRCLDFLKDNLSVSNVCDCILGSKLKDEDLKSLVIDFLMENAAEVLRSDEWKTFMEDYPDLASKTMHALLLRG